MQQVIWKGGGLGVYYQKDFSKDMGRIRKEGLENVAVLVDDLVKAKRRSLFLVVWREKVQNKLSLSVMRKEELHFQVSVLLYDKSRGREKKGNHAKEER